MTNFFFIFESRVGVMYSTNKKKNQTSNLLSITLAHKLKTNFMFFFSSII